MIDQLPIIICLRIYNHLRLTEDRCSLWKLMLDMIHYFLKLRWFVLKHLVDVFVEALTNSL